MVQFHPSIPIDRPKSPAENQQAQAEHPQPKPARLFASIGHGNVQGERNNERNFTSSNTQQISNLHTAWPLRLLSLSSQSRRAFHPDGPGAQPGAVIATSRAFGGLLHRWRSCFVFKVYLHRGGGEVARCFLVLERKTL